MTDGRLTQLGEGRFRLEGALNFGTVSRLAASGRELLRREASVDIDLGGVESANSAGLALLLEWMDLARASGARLSYRNLPESLVRIAAVSNLDSLLPTG
ncbi:MAG: STAS domain-containing protein [Thiocapsa sp.]|jgi:phospholipid transport system transporter-binding protein|nr:STAS domain-containing protein [Thiocapsa sp.]MCG6896207.1 STAS domain-containing protein [Thiocapsa sp.]MCG6983671.1 STAS domain-containing protein [Thiocapsa sp.]